MAQNLVKKIKGIGEADIQTIGEKGTYTFTTITFPATLKIKSSEIKTTTSIHFPGVQKDFERAMKVEEQVVRKQYFAASENEKESARNRNKRGVMGAIAKQVRLTQLDEGSAKSNDAEEKTQPKPVEEQEKKSQSDAVGASKGVLDKRKKRLPKFGEIFLGNPNRGVISGIATAGVLLAVAVGLDSADLIEMGKFDGAKIDLGFGQFEIPAFDLAPEPESGVASPAPQNAEQHPTTPEAPPPPEVPEADPSDFNDFPEKPRAEIEFTPPKEVVAPLPEPVREPTVPFTGVGTEGYLGQGGAMGAEITALRDTMVETFGRNAVGAESDKLAELLTNADVIYQNGGKFVYDGSVYEISRVPGLEPGGFVITKVG